MGNYAHKFEELNSTGCKVAIVAHPWFIPTNSNLLRLFHISAFQGTAESRDLTDSAFVCKL